MLIAITSHACEVDDAHLCVEYNHRVKFVSPVKPLRNSDAIEAFVKAANNCEFDAILFTSAFAAIKIAPFLNSEIASKVRIIANGPQTAKKLDEIKLDAEMLPFFYSKDLIPYLGRWIRGKKIGIPRADIAYMKLSHDIECAGGIPCEYKCYDLAATNEELDIKGCGAVLFTSPAAFMMAKLPDTDDVIEMAIGEVTEKAMMYMGHIPDVVGDGSIEGTLKALNVYLITGCH
ncbi:MAG TPA: uroporphyrinogen-III synthase [Methanocorpusculum sp.]|nr:uroporphyrinogen-III synthase [Methanocorpusculum sp.]